MFQILTLYEGATNIHVLKVLICGFGGCCMFLTQVWHLDLGFYMVTGLWYIHALNFDSLS